MCEIRSLFLSVALLSASSLVGCAHGQREQVETLQRSVERAAPPTRQEDIAWTTEHDAATPAGLERGELVRAVLARNPTLEAARQAWQSVIHQQRQATTLADPTVSYELAPASIRSNNVRYGQVIRVEQHFPWPSTLGLAGDAVLADAEAMGADYHAVKLDLALAASVLFDELVKVDRLIALNVEHRRLTEDIKAAALSQYQAGRAPQQEPLQAEVELSHVLHEAVLLEADRAVVVARINQLLHRLPEAPLPPPRREEVTAPDLGDSMTLQEQAIESRPELAAGRARVTARESDAELTQREFFPELGIMGEYNSMWREAEHRWMLGVSLNLPVQVRARRGALDSAEADARRARANLEGLTDEVRSQVDQRRRRVLEAHHVLTLYQDRLLPAAEAQIQAARAGYEAGRNSFQALIDAERSLRKLEIEYEQARASLGQRTAELARALGDFAAAGSGGAP